MGIFCAGPTECVKFAPKLHTWQSTGLWWAITHSQRKTCAWFTWYLRFPGFTLLFGTFPHQFSKCVVYEFGASRKCKQWDKLAVLRGNIVLSYIWHSKNHPLWQFRPTYSKTLHRDKVISWIFLFHRLHFCYKIENFQCNVMWSLFWADKVLDHKCAVVLFHRCLRTCITLSTLHIYEWWVQLGVIGFIYSAQVAGALLTCYNGHTVESTIGEMGHIFINKRGRLAYNYLL